MDQRQLKTGGSAPSGNRYSVALARGRPAEGEADDAQPVGLFGSHEVDLALG
jgi:hypothetical protein